MVTVGVYHNEDDNKYGFVILVGVPGNYYVMTDTGSVYETENLAGRIGTEFASIVRKQLFRTPQIIDPSNFITPVNPIPLELLSD